MKKILVANRGEIACRIIKTAQRLGIKTVAVYSDIDRNALHVIHADEAYPIGPAPSNESYLVGDKIIEVAKQSKADAIHPGYGFLSENAKFTKKVQDAGINFIGPSPEAMEIMGSKLAAKAAVKAYNIPMVPGTDHAIRDPKEAIEVAKEIGFPILIKASAGGGGKGMRVVEKEEELEENMERAISEAESSFGDGAVFVEKYISSPRHIEIQIMADQHGNTCHIFERECSIQRRHQKVIEEAPSAVLTEALREEMGQAAIQVAKACKYVGAGTVEFLLDENMNFYFLEMNTRLQVEHPVTELISGLDLVEEQIRVASNLPLSFKQEDLKINGHSIEIRIYAEDPENGWLPGVGNLEAYKEPQGKHIRVDSGYQEGMEIPIYYDPMISKLIVWASNRNEAIKRMKHAINNYTIQGIPSTLSFGQFVMDHPAFIEGEFDTHFVKKYFNPEGQDKDSQEVAALFSVHFHNEQQAVLQVSESKSSNWSNRNANE